MPKLFDIWWQISRVPRKKQYAATIIQRTYRKYLDYILDAEEFAAKKIAGAYYRYLRRRQLRSYWKGIKFENVKRATVEYVLRKMERPTVGQRAALEDRITQYVNELSVLADAHRRNRKKRRLLLLEAYGAVYGCGDNRKGSLGIGCYRRYSARPACIRSLAGVGVRSLSSCSNGSTVFASATTGAVFAWGFGLDGSHGLNFSKGPETRPRKNTFRNRVKQKKWGKPCRVDIYQRTKGSWFIDWVDRGIGRKAKRDRRKIESELRRDEHAFELNLEKKNTQSSKFPEELNELVSLSTMDGAEGSISSAQSLSRPTHTMLSSNCVAVANSRYHGVAAMQPLGLAMWGVNGRYRVMGAPSMDTVYPSPELLQGLSKERIVQVAAGEFMNAAVTMGGRMIVWGNPSTMEHAERLHPASVWTRSDVPLYRWYSLKSISIRQVSVGQEHAAAISTLGRLYTWGSGGGGRLGHGDNHSRDTPTPVEAFKDEIVLSVSCSTFYNAAIVAVPGVTGGISGMGWFTEDFELPQKAQRRLLGQPTPRKPKTDTPWGKSPGPETRALTSVLEVDSQASLDWADQVVTGEEADVIAGKKSGRPVGQGEEMKEDEELDDRNEKLRKALVRWRQAELIVEEVYHTPDSKLPQGQKRFRLATVFDELKEYTAQLVQREKERKARVENRAMWNREEQKPRTRPPSPGSPPPMPVKEPQAESPSATSPAKVPMNLSERVRALRRLKGVMAKRADMERKARIAEMRRQRKLVEQYVGDREMPVASTTVGRHVPAGEVWTWGSNESGALGQEWQTYSPLPAPIKWATDLMTGTGLTEKQLVVAGVKRLEGNEEALAASTMTGTIDGGPDAAVNGEAITGQPKPEQPQVVGSDISKKFLTASLEPLDTGTSEQFLSGVGVEAGIGVGDSRTDGMKRPITHYAQQGNEAEIRGWEHTRAQREKRIDEIVRLWEDEEPWYRTRLPWGVQAGGTRRNHPKRKRPIPPVLFQSISCGAQHMAAVSVLGEVYTWGSNAGGALGRPVMEELAHDPLKPQPVGPAEVDELSGPYNEYMEEKEKARIQAKEAADLEALRNGGDVALSTYRSGLSSVGSVMTSPAKRLGDAGASVERHTMVPVDRTARSTVDGGSVLGGGDGRQATSASAALFPRPSQLQQLQGLPVIQGAMIPPFAAALGAPPLYFKVPRELWYKTIDPSIWDLQDRTGKHIPARNFNALVSTTGGKPLGHPARKEYNYMAADGGLTNLIKEFQPDGDSSEDEETTLAVGTGYHRPPESGGIPQLPLAHTGSPGGGSVAGGAAFSDQMSVTTTSTNKTWKRRKKLKPHGPPPYLQGRAPLQESGILVPSATFTFKQAKKIKEKEVAPLGRMAPNPPRQYEKMLTEVMTEVKEPRERRHMHEAIRLGTDKITTAAPFALRPYRPEDAMLEPLHPKLRARAFGPRHDPMLAGDEQFSAHSLSMGRLLMGTTDHIASLQKDWDRYIATKGALTQPTPEEAMQLELLKQRQRRGLDLPPPRETLEYAAWMKRYGAKKLKGKKGKDPLKESYVRSQRRKRRLREKLRQFGWTEGRRWPIQAIPELVREGLISPRRLAGTPFEQHMLTFTGAVTPLTVVTNMENNVSFDDEDDDPFGAMSPVSEASEAFNLSLPTPTRLKKRFGTPTAKRREKETSGPVDEYTRVRTKKNIQEW